jgi:hypothetical protein
VIALREIPQCGSNRAKAMKFDNASQGSAQAGKSLFECHSNTSGRGRYCEAIWRRKFYFNHWTLLDLTLELKNKFEVNGFSATVVTVGCLFRQKYTDFFSKIRLRTRRINPTRPTTSANLNLGMNHSPLSRASGYRTVCWEQHLIQAA